jgi:hypothetical protein
MTIAALTRAAAQSLSQRFMVEECPRASIKNWIEF